VLTVFAVPKPFAGHIGVIQRNAVRSWRALHPGCQIVLCGDEPGSADAALELGVERLLDVDTNEFGTPLLSSVFAGVQAGARHDLLCYANADMLLFPDLADAVRRVEAAYDRFLVVGETFDLEVGSGLLAFDDAEAQALEGRARAAGTRRGRKAIDFFVFRRGTLGEVLDFAVGRPCWDNWVIWRARSLRMPVVDVTDVATVIHQSHGYGHVQHVRGSRWEGPEGDANFELMRWEERRFSLDDATHVALPDGGLAPKRTSLQHRIRTELVRHDRTVPVARVLDHGYRRLRRVFSVS
jgi:hypothetical protein